MAQTNPQYTVPGMSTDAAQRVIDLLQEPPPRRQRPRTDPQAHPLERRRPALHRGARDARPAGGGVRAMVDDDRRAHRDPRRLADRHARRPGRRPAAGTTTRIGRADHPASTSVRSTLVYRGVISDHRAAIDEVDELDPVTQDMLIGQTEKLGAVPLVHPRPPREHRRRARDRGRDGRDRGRRGRCGDRAGYSRVSTRHQVGHLLERGRARLRERGPRREAAGEAVDRHARGDAGRGRRSTLSSTTAQRARVDAHRARRRAGTGRARACRARPRWR